MQGGPHFMRGAAAKNGGHLSPSFQGRAGFTPMSAPEANGCATRSPPVEQLRVTSVGTSGDPEEQSGRAVCYVTPLPSHKQEGSGAEGTGGSARP